MKTLPDFFLFLIILCVSIITIPGVHSKWIPDQQLSLLHFKKSLAFDASLSSKLISWNSSADCCSWVGVTCSTNGRIIGLDISSESISGGIDNSSSLFHLQYLQSLNLADNLLGDGNGSQLIPSAIGQLTSLRYLNLSHNYYSGEIPIEISHLTGLKVLDISDNHFLLHDTWLYLEIPNLHMLVENLTELRELYLDDVQISAPGSVWCEAISSSLPNLRVLSLSDCSLSGPFHQSLAKLHSTLSVIHLDFNNISAPVPPFFANFSNLTSLSLGNCGLHGTFPKEIFQFPSLQSIDLSDNPQLDGSLPEFPKNGSLEHLILQRTNFSGSLPNSIGNLKMLSEINIYGCNFTGSIPLSISNLSQLTYLAMDENKFEGSIPSFSTVKNLESLDLSKNRLTGNIYCTNWGNLTKLSSLSLAGNMLNGNIPSSLLSLPSLDSLILYDNQFSGQFPEISNISSYFVKYLDLESNNLEGSIPMSIFNLPSLTSLYLSSNNFSGSFPLDNLQHLRNLFDLGLSDNNLFLTHDATNFSYSYFPQFQYLTLASGRLTAFPHFLRNQSKLEILDLSENQIRGKIPNWIWRSSNLFELNLSCNSLETIEGPTINLTSIKLLDLHSNQLHGKIPISSSPNMYYLDYSKNNFNSTIPTTIGDLLRSTGFFSISSNKLHGIIPGSICNSLSLEILDLSNNSLSGTVPQCLTTMKTLAVLNLRQNNLTNVGELSKNCNLKTLDIGGNQLHGQFPKSIANCKKLEVLNLGNNKMIDPFPCFLMNTSTLRVLVLRSNKLYGRIECPKSNGSWPMLQIIDLAHNNFIGELPGRAFITWQAMRAHEEHSSELDHLEFRDEGSSQIYYQDAIIVTNKGFEMELVKILTVFTSIDISCNKLNGSIPKEIGEFKSLHVLNLSNNAFTGAIPSALSKLSQIESLDLSNNNLSGKIPPQLTRLTFLEVLDLSNNQLVGRIPSSNQFSTFPKSSFEGNKDLFGPPLTEDDKTRFSPPASNKSHPNSRDEIDWDIISIEIGFTFGFGIAIGSLLLCKRWRKWYYKALYNILVKIFPQLEQRLGNHRRHVYISQRF